MASMLQTRSNAADSAPVPTKVPQLLPLLKQYFGFTSFRPLQEEIIRDALARKDVFALLPTGGGKSLCFQLPAMAQPGLTVVVSPLIALMKDQVDALQASGVPATRTSSETQFVSRRYPLTIRCLALCPCLSQNQVQDQPTETPERTAPGSWADAPGSSAGRIARPGS